MTDATPALQSHDLSREGINLWTTYILFWPHKDMKGLPGWGISSMPGPPPRQHKLERRYIPGTHSVSPTRRTWNDDYGSQMIFEDLCGPKVSWHLVLQVRKKPKKPLPRNLSRPGIEPGPSAWQVRMLPPVPQRRTVGVSPLSKALSGDKKRCDIRARILSLG